MAEPTAEQTRTVVNITKNIERGYQAVRTAAYNIQSLLQSGRATCADLKAYNTWALAIYAQQQSMTQTLILSGASAGSVPYPTLFLWKGVRGEDAWKIDCGSSAMSGSLHGVLAAAMESGPNAQYVNPSDIAVTHGQDPGPGTLPEYNQLIQNGGLGLFWFIVIAAVSIVAVSGAVIALASYFKTNSIQEQTTARSAIALEGYAAFTAARVQCFQACLTKPNTTATGCSELCERTITAPKLSEPNSGAGAGLGVLGTIGLMTVLGVVGVVGWNKYRSSRDHAPRFE